ncbi:MAG: S-adenosylmethionine decarboxylase [Chloroflexota bacterium]|nr:S-adenosylmethionine decarboxylase [Chloroflexota bacterium]MDE2941142.1 S-adenosylmethionine decarboxylase [Chloroflexota bacterium]MDE3267332.1 S-adenosylmethionine decarboxylase [Chloroflexota bacterium]
MHLLIDGFGGDLEMMKDEAAVCRFLDNLPDSIGMNKIISPVVTTYNGPVPEDWGVSGFVMIAESHISIHTFPERAYVNIDVFSCKDFDYREALDRIMETFSLEQVKHWVIGRGLDFTRPTNGAPVTRGRARGVLTGAR